MKQYNPNKHHRKSIRLAGYDYSQAGLYFVTICCDELLESVDLSTYGIERVRLNEKLNLDDTETSLDPNNANPRGAHGTDEKEVLDIIIKDFNDKWFANWEATPEDKREKFLSFTNKVLNHPDYKTKYYDNKDEYTRNIAFKKILEDVVISSRKSELDFYKLWISDIGFQEGIISSLQRYLTK